MPHCGFDLESRFSRTVGLRIERIACKERVRQLDLIPAEGEPVLAHIRHAQSGDDGQGEGAVDQALSKLGALAVFVVEMNLVGVVGQQGEPDIVRLGHGPSETALIDVPDLEILEVPPFPSRLDRHDESSKTALMLRSRN